MAHHTHGTVVSGTGVQPSRHARTRYLQASTTNTSTLVLLSDGCVDLRRAPRQTRVGKRATRTMAAQGNTQHHNTTSGKVICRSYTRSCKHAHILGQLITERVQRNASIVAAPATSAVAASRWRVHHATPN